MRFLLAPSTLLYTTLLIASRKAFAKPYPRSADTEDVIQLQNSTLAARQNCANPCGYSGHLCCAADQYCYTDANQQAQCGSNAVTAAGGYWQYYTSTFVQTGLVTRTEVYSTYIVGGVVAAAPTTTAPAQAPACKYYLNETPCGTICCAGGQYCLREGQCAASGAGSSGGGVFITPVYSAPVRPTSSTLIVVTATVSPTTTVPFETPIATGANATISTTSAQASTSLSGGAIAGIVIGVIAGILLLTLLCLALCARSALGALGGLFGGGKKKGRREEEVYIEEHHHHAGGASGAGGRRWYGDRPGRVERPPPKKKSSGFGNLGAIAAGLGGLAVALGLKRKYDRRHDEKSSAGTYSEYTYSSDYTSSSE
ncbi:hypothetical protein W97_00342 [Coniosporium apollinis CBS 100218]|uniref:Mid2 domain-containing protein n=1 Tax=Coniosporium apollinis (strain CBS 100218) TaxID=1168221 RepID=R7YHN5_CONA1|nr:uncharacterized protein W97_00342 [Coniosporium apollinis CBS 100218]EON61131.1 hypothetical protein W97_00342 [Coniosporium apollinis CBS 100218]